MDKLTNLKNISERVSSAYSRILKAESVKPVNTENIKHLMSSDFIEIPYGDIICDECFRYVPSIYETCICGACSFSSKCPDCGSDNPIYDIEDVMDSTIICEVCNAEYTIEV